MTHLPGRAADKRAADKRAVPMALGALTVAMLSFPFGATLAEGMFPAVGAQGATGLRLAVASVMLACVLRPWRSLPPAAFWPALLGYGVSLGGMNLCFYMALRTVPLGITVAIEFAGPLVVAVLSSHRAADVGWVGLAVVGLLFLLPDLRTQHALDPQGVAWAFGAGTGWGLYIVFGQRAGAALGAQATAWGMLVAACITLPIGIAHAGTALLHPATLRTAVGVGLFSSALPYSLEMVALTRVPARVYGTMTSLEPAIGAVMGMLFLQQHLFASQWAGIAVVMAAAAGAAASATAVVVLPE